MGFRAVLRHVFDTATEWDEKEVMERANPRWERNGQTFQLAETISSLNLLPGLVVTVGMISLRYQCGRLDPMPNKKKIRPKAKH